MPIGSSCTIASPAPEWSSPASELGLGGRLGGPIARDAGDNLGLGLLSPHPGRNPNPLARFEVLVVLEKMRDLPSGDLRQVARRLERAIQSRELVRRHREDLGVFSRLA